jgi:UDP-glucose:(heptosyl)LPS alpha-1,3-glucosyltransferase
MTRVALLKSRIDHAGGLEKIARRLATAFKARGCQVTTLTSDLDAPRPEHLSLTTRSPLSLVDLFRFDRACFRWLKDNPCDIVFGLDRNRSQTHYRAGNGCHAAYLEHRRLTDSFGKRLSFPLNPLHRAILHFERRAFESPELRILFVNSHMVKEEILKHYRVAPKRIHVIHNGADWQGLEGAFGEWERQQVPLRKKYGLSGDSFQLLFVGQGYRRKGLGFLLHGLAQRRQQDWQLSVVGKDRERAHFEALAHCLDLGKRVVFLGPRSRSEVTELYQLADALAIPSTYDPFANVTVEAMAMGLYVLSSPHNGGSEIITPDQGTIIPCLEDRDALAEGLDQVFKHPKSSSSAKDIRSYARNFDQNQQFETLLDLSLAHAR